MLKRWMSALLAIAMCVSLLPVSALGAELDTTIPSDSVTELVEEPAVTAGEEETMASTEAATVPVETAAVETEAATESAATGETAVEDTEASAEMEAAGETALCAHGLEADCPVCALEARLAALPGEDAVFSMTEEEKAALLEELAALLDAYDALTAEQQAMVTGMERVSALFTAVTASATALEAAGANEGDFRGIYLNGESDRTQGQTIGDTYQVTFSTEGSGEISYIEYTLYRGEKNDFANAKPISSQKFNSPKANALTYSFEPKQAGYYWVEAKMENVLKEDSSFVTLGSFQVFSMAFDKLEIVNSKKQFTTGDEVLIEATIRTTVDPDVTYEIYKYDPGNEAAIKESGELCGYVKQEELTKLLTGENYDKKLLVIPDSTPEEAVPGKVYMDDGEYLVHVFFSLPEAEGGELREQFCKFSVYRDGLQLKAITTEDVNGKKTNKFGMGESICVSLEYTGKGDYNGVAAYLYLEDESTGDWNKVQDMVINGADESGRILGVTFGAVKEAGRYKITVSIIDEKGNQWLPLTTYVTVSEEHIHRYVMKTVEKVEPTKDAPGHEAYSYMECIYSSCNEEDEGHYAYTDGTPMTKEQYDAFVESKTIYYPAESVVIQDYMGTVLGDSTSITFDPDDTDDNNAFYLKAVVNPEGGANQKVFWSSSNSAVAKITLDEDENGKEIAKVTILKPGTAVITARASGSTVKDTVTLNAVYKYNTKNIILKLVRSEQGEDGAVTETEFAEPYNIQVTERVQLKAYCDDGKTPIELKDLDIRIATGGASITLAKEIEEIDDQQIVNYTLTGEKTGTFKLRAALMGDPLGRMAEISGKVVPIVPNDWFMYDFSAWATVGTDQYIEEDGFKDNADGFMALYQRKSPKTQTYTLTLRGYNNQLGGESFDFAWKTDNKNLADVKMNTKTGVVTITVKANQAGECTLTATSKLNAELQAIIKVVVHDYQPKLDTNQLTLNMAKLDFSGKVNLSWSELDVVVPGELNMEGRGLRLIDTKTGHTVTELRISEYKDGTITIDENFDVNGNSLIRTGTWKLMVEVPTAHRNGTDCYLLPLTVVVQEVKPKATYKQTRRVNLKGVDGYGVLEFTAKAGKEDVKVNAEIIGNDFELVPAGENVYWIIPLYKDRTNLDQKLNNKVTLHYTYDGFDDNAYSKKNQAYEEKAFTIGVENRIVTKTINSLLTDNAVYTDLVEGFTDSGFVVDQKRVWCKQGAEGFKFECADGEKDTLFIGSDQTQDNGTYNLYVTVTNGLVTLTGQINVVVRNVLPTVSFKQIKAVNLLDPYSKGLLTVTAKGTDVREIELTGSDFKIGEYDEEKEAWELENKNQGSTKLDKTGTLTISFGSEYHADVHVDKTFTVRTENIEDRAYLESNTLTLYRKLQNMADSTTLSTYWETTTLYDEENSAYPYMVIKNADQYKGLKLEYDWFAQKLVASFDGTPIKAGNYKYYIEVTMDPQNEKPKKITKYTLTVKVAEAPKVAISPNAVKLSIDDSKLEPVKFKVTGTKFGNAKLTGLTILPDDTSNRYPFGDWFKVTRIGETDEWEVTRIGKSALMRAGRTYAVKLQPEFETDMGYGDVSDPIVLKISITQ